MKEQLLPSSLEAEQSVLGGLLFIEHAMSGVADILAPADFYYDSYRHRDIYQAMCYLYAHEREINTVTVLDRLQHMGLGLIRDTPARRYLESLFDLVLYTGEDITEQVKIVKNASLRRKGYAAITQAASILANEQDGALALEQIQTLFSDIEPADPTELEPLARVMEHYLAQMDVQHRERGKVTGIETGFDELDSKLGGLQKQELIVLGGRPGEGKTSLMLNIIYDILTSARASVALFSLEMSKHDLANRLVSMDTGIDSQCLRARWLEDEHWEAIVQSATDALASEHIFIDDSGDVTLSSMRAKLQRHKARHGLDLVVLDYLQLMQFEDEGKGRVNEVAELSKISRGLKKIAKHFDVPVLALASLNRAVDARADKRLHLSDLRGSGSIEFDADVVLFIARSQDREGYALVTVEKNRNGQSGPTSDITLRFDGSVTRFYETSLEVSR